LLIKGFQEREKMERESARERERDNEGWIYVSPRRRRGLRLDQHKTSNKDITAAGADGTTTCYVNNLPEDISKKEVERMFERWGKVVDVYLAKKRNKMGRFFGFVRFSNVKDEKWLESQLRDVWFGTYKVWINISRFEKPNRRYNERSHNREFINKEPRRVQSYGEEKEQRRVTNNKENNIRRWNNSRRQEGRSFADIVQNKEARKNNEQTDGEVKKSTGISITIEEEEMSWVKKGYVGFMRNIKELDIIQQRLIEEGITSIRVIPMGGEKVFIKVDEKEDFSTLVKETNHFFQQYFTIIREWEPRDSAGARYVWVRVLGVPVHAWRAKVFSRLTISFGKLIRVDMATENMERLDVARLFIRTPSIEVINKVMKVQINNDSFLIRITEEMCECNIEAEDEMECDESDDDDNANSVNSDDTFIPPSIVSVEDEDEETIQKIEENFEQLMEHVREEGEVNVEVHEKDKTLNTRDTNSIKETERVEEKRNDEDEAQENNVGGGDKENPSGGYVGHKVDGELNENEKVENLNIEETSGSKVGEEGVGSVNRASITSPIGQHNPIPTKEDTIRENGGVLHNGPTQGSPVANNHGAEDTRISVQNQESQDTIQQERNRVVNTPPNHGTQIIMTTPPENGNEVKKLATTAKHADWMKEGSRSEAEGTKQVFKERRKRRKDILKEKKKAQRKGKKGESRCTCNQRTRTQDQVKTAPNIVIPENEADKRNWVLLHGEAREVARDVWDLGKEFGLIHRGEEGEIFQELTEGMKGSDRAT
jgi:hypothetical protein